MAAAVYFLIIFDSESASLIVWSFVRICILLLRIPNISVLLGLKVETYGSTSSLFCVCVLKSVFLGMDLAFLMPSENTVSG